MTVRTAVAAPAPRRVTCRYLRRNGDQCTAEAVDPDHEFVVCIRHLALAMELLRQAGVPGLR